MGEATLLFRIKGRVVDRCTSWRCTGKGQLHEIFRRNAFKLHLWICPEAKALVISGIAQHHTAHGALLTQLRQPGLNQPRPNAARLPVRAHSNGT